MFVFNSLSDAKEAIINNHWHDKDGYRIFECECHGEISKESLLDEVWLPNSMTSKIIQNSTLCLGIKLTKEIVDNKILKEGDKFIWSGTVGDFNVVLAQSAPNKFMVFQACDMNRMSSQSIDGERTQHGVSLTRLEAFAAEHNATIKLG